MVAREPFEECAGFRLQVLRQPAGCAQIGRGRSQTLEHRGPIFDGGTNCTQRACESRFDRRKDGRVRLAHDLEVNERFRLRRAVRVAVARVLHAEQLAFRRPLDLK